MPFAKPRPIATVDVKLITNTKVKVNSDLTVKDHYAGILKNKEKWTDDVQEYNRSIANIVSNKNKDNDNVPKTPKYLIQNAELIGNAVIASPSTPSFDAFPARLKSYSSKDSGAGGGSTDSGDLNWINEIHRISKEFNFYVAYPRTGNVTGQNTSNVGGGFSGNQSSLGSSGAGGTKSNNVWIPKTDGTDELCPFNEVPDGICINTTMKKNPYALISSEFFLEENQPFSFTFNFGEFDSRHKFASKKEEGASFALAGTTNAKKTEGKGLERKVIPYVSIFWGRERFNLTYYKDGRVSLVVDGTQVGKEFILPKVSNKVGFGTSNQITIYPLGSYVYVYAGSPDTEATISKQFVGFNIGKALQIASGPINLFFSCSNGSFNFSPVIHPKKAVIISPPFGGGFSPEKKIVTLSYLGKFGVGARASPIVLPDKGDKNQIFKYLRQYPITYKVSEVSTGVFITIVELGVPGEIEEIEAVNQMLQNMLNEIKDEWNQLFQGASSGSMSWPDAYDQANNAVEERFQDVIDNFEETFSRMFDRWEVNGDPTSYVNGAQVDLYEDANAIFGGSGGGNASNSLDRISGDWKADAFEALLRQAGENIYSSALFYSQTTLKAGLQDVNLAPDPQIENSDVINVTVNQAVEQNKATITLNNRYNCDEDGPGHGRYTYIPGKGNFTGIKPIQIKMGYTGEKSQGEMDTIFTGYITNRDYSRSAPASSTCTLHCEDMSKKLKEQFACNLPFYDGWCHLAVIYHLGKQAGLDDNEILIYQDPRKASSKQRIRDLLKGDPETFTGGCFDGHVAEDPPGGAGLPGAYLHMCLPLAALGVEEPNYNFSFGTPLWTCMQRIREFSQFYLYANNFGNIIYGPPKTTVQNTGFEFKEVDVNKDYNEFQRQLQVTYDTADTRNAVFLQGISFLPNKNLPGGGSWGTHVHVQKKKNFPNDIGDASYCPWLRYAFLRNPKWEYPNLAAFACAEIFRRATRNKFVADFGAWGQPSLFPYDVVLINEEQLNETGSHNKSVIIAAHTITADTEKLQLNSNFSCELFDPGNVNYDPNLPCAVRD